MPFFYDFESIEWPEDQNDFWPKPAPEEYEYVTPDFIGGTASPVAFPLIEGVDINV